jgi:hypothetical protein
MVVKKILALTGALSAIALAPAALAKPTLRIEGKKKTLLVTTAVGMRGPEINKGGHSCAGSTAAGALSRATHGRWSGKWYSGLGIEVFTILGETDQYSTTHTYWELFVGNVSATMGLCSLNLHPGEQLLLAAVPANGTVYPLGISAPSSATAGRAFTVKARGFDAKGHAKPLAGAEVDGKRTNSHGVVRITPTRAGKLTLRASKNGYIRDEATVRVT